MKGPNLFVCYLVEYCSFALLLSKLGSNRGYVLAVKMASQVKLRSIYLCMCHVRESRLYQLVKPDNFSTLVAPEEFRTIYDQAQNIKLTAQFLINCYDVRSKIVF